MRQILGHRKMNKKAIFFTFVAILLLSAVIFSFSIYARYRYRARTLVVETRVNTMNSFIKDIDKDITRGAFISSHRSILSIVQHVSSSGVFLNDSEEVFKEVFLNGSIGGENQPLIADTTFNDWIDKTKEEGGRINLEIDFTVKDVEVNQSDPWNVDIYLDVEIFASDATDIASWNISKQFKVELPIEGFEDPIYSSNTDGKFLNIINKTPFTDFVTGNDTSNLQAHTEKSYYLAWSTAPSFLMRLEGNLSGSPYGIESLINLQTLIDQGGDAEERSAVDHIYWSNKSVTSYNINNMPSWFMMDDEYNDGEDKTHLELYEVNGLIS